jgi:L-lysine 2,3-aminomutase
MTYVGVAVELPSQHTVFAFMASWILDNTRQTVSPDLADWQSVLAEGVRSPGELCRLLGLEPSVAAEAERAAGGWPLLAPRPYLARIRRGDPADPLLLQLLPRAAETATVPGYRADPLGETGAMHGPGLLRKYQGRILIVASGSCAVHCRYCFRRHFLGQGAGTRGEGRGARGEEAADSPSKSPNLQISKSPNPCSPHHCPPLEDGILRTIASDPSIHEVILSGGDPLTLPDEPLARLAEQLAQIPHLRRLRIHTRLPVMIPQRVNDDLLSWLRANRLSPIVVVQINHSAEIDGEVASAFGRLVDAGIPLLNQSVLLRGVNDRADVLAELCERLVELRVMPYYLHQLDAVAGAAHFEVPVATGLALIAELRARLPGYAVPRYVRETPGAANKEVLA